MKTYYQKRFLKDLANIPSKQRTQIEKFVFVEVPEYDSVQDANKIEKMTGYPGFFKIRFGAYRVGLKIENGGIIFIRVLHRKEIYRYFP